MWGDNFFQLLFSIIIIYISSELNAKLFNYIIITMNIIWMPLSFFLIGYFGLFPGRFSDKDLFPDELSDLVRFPSLFSDGNLELLTASDPQLLCNLFILLFTFALKSSNVSFKTICYNFKLLILLPEAFLHPHWGCFLSFYPLNPVLILLTESITNFRFAEKDARV